VSEPTPAVAPVRVSVTVEVSREHAFAVFTDRFDTWWPRSHHTATTELAEVRLEPRQGGRWYEIDTDGVEGNWGTVLAWDPPSRLVLGWQLDSGFRYDPDFVTEVEVTFTAEGPHRTHVLLEHRNLERYGERAEEMRASFDSDGGWNGILIGFAEVANNTEIVNSVADPQAEGASRAMSRSGPARRG
jgi:uncharacterized protein YndB with AHSA1/START domain